ncbi:hypothetical protein V6N11_070516 [Hibiscus sabdariffa]|uniref:Uncharacterized protein n=1 Tax=Hibiscus sabdariffa TaxID=183260 RepID=A0ABR2QF88_9ROSI
MADLVSYGNAQRDIDQALIALKKGAQLLKYGRKGKPKFCPFRLSNSTPDFAALLSYSLLLLATVAPIAVADCYENDFPCVFDNECCSGYYSYANGFGGAFGTCWPLPN